MRAGTTLAIALLTQLCLAVTALGAWGSVGLNHKEILSCSMGIEYALSVPRLAAQTRRSEEADEKGVGNEEDRGQPEAASRDTTDAGVAADRSFPRLSLTPGLRAEAGSFKSIWERLALVPEMRWLGSGTMGGVEGWSLRGRGVRRGAVLVDGAASLPDLNIVAPSLVDTVGILSLMEAQAHPYSDGGEAISIESHTRMWAEPVGFLYLAKGDFASTFNGFTFGRRVGSLYFAVDLVGRSFGRAASYEGYSSDSAAFTGAYRVSPGGEFTLRAQRFRSDVSRYTADRTKTNLNSMSISAKGETQSSFSWLGQAYFLGGAYKYLANGPVVEDNISTYGTAVDLWPFGGTGGHRASIAVRRESLERSFASLPAPQDGIPSPDDGSRHSTDATGIYEAALGTFGRTQLKGLARIDHKEFFGWMPAWSVALTASDESFGNLRVEGGRTSFAPDFLQIYSPRDEAARPTWFMAGQMKPETGWEVSTSWKHCRAGWTMSAGGFGALREHVLAPPVESLGLGSGIGPALVSPLEDLGDGSAAGFWASWSWVASSLLRAGGSYSLQRSRAAGNPVPFQPAHSLGLWVKGERKYFSDDLTLGIVLRGYQYSSQRAPTGQKLPSFGVGEALGYAAISDIVFFYQMKNLETRARPSPVLDVESGEYLLAPGPEIRMGLVWYLPG